MFKRSVHNAHFNREAKKLRGSIENHTATVTPSSAILTLIDIKLSRRTGSSRDSNELEISPKFFKQICILSIMYYQYYNLPGKTVHVRDIP